ncbi:MAG TPA: ComEC/Rec2 family competence protein [Candidatus Saccharimonadia bacterium]
MLLAGVMVGRLWSGYIEVSLLVVAAIGLLLFKLRFGLIVLLIFSFGLWRGISTDFSRTPLGDKLGQTVSLVGVVADDPSVTAGNQVGFKLGNVEMDGRGIGQEVQVYTPYKSLQRGYRVAVMGKLKPRRGSIPVQASFARVAIVSDQVSLLERVRQRFFISARVAMPEPASGFGLGLLIGVKSLIAKDLQEVLTTVGLSHLIAVSGYNLTIIIHAMRRLSDYLSHFSVTALSLWLIAGFLVVLVLVRQLLEPV